MDKLSLKDLPLEGKRVLMRVDFNVPLDAQGNILDDTRVKAALPSIAYILQHGASLILMSHLGRPKDREKALSLEPCARALSKLLNRPVQFAPDCIGQDVEALSRKLAAGEVLLLENLRFHAAEKQGDISFAKQLAALGDVYVNEAFGSAHRAHASTVTIAQFFPHKAAAGFLLEKEIFFHHQLLKEPARPFCAVIGGAKISSKIATLQALVQKVDSLLIGGAMAYTFLKAKGISIGSSLWEEELLDAAEKIILACENRGIKLLLPVDSIVAKEISINATAQHVKGDIPEGLIGVDIGPETISLFEANLRDSKTILWNGPLGVFERPQFAKGTYAIASAIAASQAVTVVGGGDTLSAIASAGIGDTITHISTGGGASLEFLELGTLPGIEALSDKGNAHASR